KMPAAARAMDLCPRHTKRGIPPCADGIVGQRRPKTWPTGATLKFGFRREDAVVAASTGKDARAMLVEQRTGEWPLGRALPEHRILRRCQQLAPLIVRVRDWKSLGRRRNRTKPRQAEPRRQPNCAACQQETSR